MEINEGPEFYRGASGAPVFNDIVSILGGVIQWMESAVNPLH